LSTARKHTLDDGKRGISTEAALRLATYFSPSPNLLVNRHK